MSVEIRQPPATEPALYASTWYDYGDYETCVIYDTDYQDAWVESTIVCQRDRWI